MNDSLYLYFVSINENLYSKLSTFLSERFNLIGLTVNVYSVKFQQ